MSDSDMELEDQQPVLAPTGAISGAASNTADDEIAIDLFRRNITQSVAAVHSLRNRVASAVGNELIGRLPSLARNTLRRNRSLARTLSDRRRNARMRVRFTALDRPTITSTGMVNLDQLRAKGLGRRDDTMVQLNLSTSYQELCEKSYELFPNLEGIDIQLLVGRRGCSLQLLAQTCTLYDVKRMVPRCSFARIWVRPAVLVGHIQLGTPTVFGRLPAIPTTSNQTVGTELNNQNQSASFVLPSTSTPVVVTPVSLPAVSAPYVVRVVRLRRNLSAPDVAPSTNTPMVLPNDCSPVTRPSSSQAVVSTPAISPSVTAALSVPVFSTRASTTNRSGTGPTHPDDQIHVPHLSTDFDLPSPVRDAVERDADESHGSMQLDMSVTEDITASINNMRSSLKEPAQVITVNRQDILISVLSNYMFVDNLTSITVEFSGEVDEDQGGLTRDMFASFWEEANTKYFRGEDVVIPYVIALERQKSREVYPVIGRILEHTVIYTGSFPPRLSQSTILSLARPDDIVDSNILIEDYTQLKPVAQGALLRRCLQAPVRTESEKKRLVRFYSVSGLGVMPTPENLRTCLLSLAQQELLDESLMFINLIRKGFSERFCQFLGGITQNELKVLTELNMPTSEKVAELVENCFLDADIRPEQEVVLNHLSNFLRELSPEKLRTFLIWSTGSSSMPNKLSVTFNSSFGLMRCPVAHTCGNVLELPVTYVDYRDFKSEFLSILANQESMCFTTI